MNNYKIPTARRWLLDFRIGNDVHNFGFLYWLLILSGILADTMICGMSTYQGFHALIQWLITGSFILSTIFAVIYLIRIRRNMLFIFWYLVISVMITYQLIPSTST